MSGIVYFSSRSGNTRRFVEKLGVPALRLLHDAPSRVDSPFVLITPTYGDASGRGAVPGPVIRFLNEARNRALLRGVIAAGNTSFGASFAAAGRVISEKCAVPLLYRFELLGTSEDVANVKEGLKRCWTRWQ